MSLSVIPVHIALIDQSGHVSLEELQTVAADLNQQIQRDFAPIWGNKASVGAYQAAPPNTWAVFIKNQLDEPGALGYHTDNSRQPLAYVEYTTDYTVTISHEVLEMIVDPWGNRMHGAPLPEGINASQVNLQSPPTPRVQYLLEMCDPCENSSYIIGSTWLSDFLMPGWYYTTPHMGVAYSHTGYCTDPRQVANGGYVSFMTPDQNWWQVFNDNGNLSVESLGSMTAEFSSMREFTDTKAREYRRLQRK
jgi:hypothetical protein